MNRIEEDDDIQDYKRPWVGLTDKEIETIEECALTKRMAIAMTTATLKEKNA
tara:strand:+ start:97 stop:252 length:156 start_codon:yes stop_codon:yes gene_type:complete